MRRLHNFPLSNGESMTAYKIYKETSVPGVLAANAIYLIAPAGKPGRLEIYATDSGGTATRQTLSESEVQAMIDAATGGGSTTFADTITARDALSPEDGEQVLVLDASGDATVASGSALYVWRQSNTSWIKLTEYESMDVTVSWADVQGRPTSTVANIDDAVTKRHSHANKSELDKVGQDGGGNPTYNGISIVTGGAASW